MHDLDFFLTVEKLFLIARALDDLLIDHYSILLHDTGLARSRTLNTLVTGVSELRHGLEALAMADPQILLRDCLDSHGLPVDNAADSGYDNHEKQA